MVLLLPVISRHNSPYIHLTSAASCAGRSWVLRVAAQETWQRALVLHEWLQAVGHTPDDRLCTTLIRVCAQHGQASTALSLYDWMRAPRRSGGAGLVPTVYTYTAALRAALSGNMIDRAYQVPPLKCFLLPHMNHWLEMCCQSCMCLVTYILRFLTCIFKAPDVACCASDSDVASRCGSTPRRTAVSLTAAWRRP